MKKFLISPKPISVRILKMYFRSVFAVKKYVHCKKLLKNKFRAGVQKNKQKIQPYFFPRYELERVAVKMIRLFGDDGFYHVYAPVAYPKVIFATWIFTGQIKKEYLTKFLPLIYDALNIRGLKVRDKLDFLVGRMVAKLEALMFHGLPNYVDKEGKTCLDLPTSDSFMAKTGKNNDYNFELPYFLAYHGEENVDMESPTPKLTNGKVLKLTPDPLKGAAMADNYRALISNWNCWVADTFGEEEDAKYVRPFYATFWSLRLLIELVHEADAKTAEEYELGDKANRFFSVYQVRMKAQNLSN